MLLVVNFVQIAINPKMFSCCFHLWQTKNYFPFCCSDTYNFVFFLSANKAWIVCFLTSCIFFYFVLLLLLLHEILKKWGVLSINKNVYQFLQHITFVILYLFFGFNFITNVTLWKVFFSHIKVHLIILNRLI